MYFSEGLRADPFSLIRRDRDLAIADYVDRRENAIKVMLEDSPISNDYARECLARLKDQTGTIDMHLMYRYFGSAYQLPLQERLQYQWRLTDFNHLTPGERYGFLPKGPDFSGYAQPSNALYSGFPLKDVDVFSYQDQAIIGEIMRDRQAIVRTQYFDPIEKLSEDNLYPCVDGDFAEAAALMVMEDNEMFSFNPHVTYALSERYDVIAPDFDTRTGTNLHHDGLYRDENNVYRGNILRVWNMVSSIPTAWIRSINNLTIDEFYEHESELYAFGAEGQLLERMLKKLFDDANVKLGFVRENENFCFLGSKSGLRHFAQPIFDNKYRNSAGEEIEITEPILRRMAALFVLERKKPLSPMKMLELDDRYGYSCEF